MFEKILSNCVFKNFSPGAVGYDVLRHPWFLSFKYFEKYFVKYFEIPTIKYFELSALMEEHW